MNKKLWIGFIVIFIAMAVLNIIVHGFILSSTYQTEEVNKIMRSEAEMNSMMWIYYVVYIFQAFFFTLIFSKWYKGKGIIEGVQYGCYMGLLMATPMAYASYAMYPMPYSLALQWFIYGIIQYIIMGIIIALVYGKNPQATA